MGAGCLVAYQDRCTVVGDFGDCESASDATLPHLSFLSDGSDLGQRELMGYLS
jgi:hypothetical protein